VQRSYVDAFGDEREADPRAVRAILAAMGIDVSSDEAAILALEALENRPWLTMLEPVTIVPALVPPAFAIACVPAGGEAEIFWTFEREDGSHAAGSTLLSNLALLDARSIGGVRYERRTLVLDVAVPAGYHRFLVRVDRREAATTVIATPGSCFMPKAFDRGASAWGLAVQVYAMLSARNLGIGDFTDLASVVRTVARAGGSLVGVNPLHLVDVRPDRAPRPYSPSSRLALSELYLDVTALPGHDPADVDLGAVRAARDGETIAYAPVAALKDRAIDAAFERFERAGPPAATAAFEAFVRGGGETLRLASRFQALAAHLSEAGVATAWQTWPEAYRDARGSAVERFAGEHAREIRRAQFVQWQAEVQLAAAAAAAEMPVGLYRDLAVGAAPGGAETWANPRALRGDVHAGAPPDVMNREGQDWAVAPFDPVALREAAYAPFVALLRANMRHAGALRIDHVMTLARLYWIPPGMPPSHGAYVAYRLDEMLAIVALESSRARCLVIGEDLGTVPDGFREHLARANVLSYRLLTFELGEDGAFVAPETYPRGALVAAGTHDLPPIASYLSGYDIELRRSIGVIDDARARREREEREAARAALFDAFARTSERSAEVERFRAAATSDAAERAELARLANTHLALAPSLIHMVQLEDVAGDLDQVNVPTTLDEHPNWRRRSTIAVDDLATDPRFVATAAALAHRRPSAGA